MLEPNRRPALALFALAAAALCAGAVAAQPEPEEPQIRTTPVAPGVHMLSGRGGNLGVSSGPDGVFLIDDEYAPMTEKVKAAVAAISEKPIRFVLNTHLHGDHTGGNENLGKEGVLIVAHDNVREGMSVERFHAFFQSTWPASPPVALPVVTFTDAVTFHLNGDQIHAFHVPPAHTDGDAVVHFRAANVIHAGDLFFNGTFPFIDIWSGGSVDGYIAALDRILALADDQTRIIPGHGPLSDRAELAGFREMLQTARDRIAALVAAGKSLEQAIEAQPLADLAEEWGKGFISADAFVRIVFEGLASE